MSHVSIIGGGNMGQAIATIVTKGGNTVEVFNSNDANKPVTGDVVFLAVPYPAVADVLAQRGDQLAGKVLVGITKNPLNFETFDPLVVPAAASAAAKTASSPSPPQPRVLKAFNTNFAAPLASGAVGELPTTGLIASGDADAKAVLADVVARRAAHHQRRFAGPRPRAGRSGLPADHPRRCREAGMDRRVRRRLTACRAGTGRPTRARAGGGTSGCSFSF